MTTPDATASDLTNARVPAPLETPLSFLLINEHRLFREGLRLIIEQLNERFQVVGEASTEEEAIEGLSGLSPAIVILDLTWPEESIGADTIVRIKATFPEARVIVVAPVESPGGVVRAIRAGANGYLTRSSGMDDVARAIDVVETGGSWIDPSLAPLVMDEYRKLAMNGSARRAERGDLTARDREFLELLANGLNNRQISTAIGLAESTVKNNLSTLFRKLGVRDRTQAVLYAIEHGIVTTGAPRS